jgi:hypothetical protein
MMITSSFGMGEKAGIFLKKPKKKPAAVVP